MAKEKQAGDGGEGNVEVVGCGEAGVELERRQWTEVDGLEWCDQAGREDGETAGADGGCGERAGPDRRAAEAADAAPDTFHSLAGETPGLREKGRWSEAGASNETPRKGAPTKPARECQRPTAAQ